MIRRIVLLGFLLSLGTVVHATTYTAASCNQPAVLAALAMAASGDTVQIPAGNCTWTAAINYTAPGSITILGAGNQTVVGGGDVTNITDHVNHNPSPGCDCADLTVNTGSASSIVRVSGMTFQQDASSVNNDNAVFVQLYGNTQNLRIDHMHYKMNMSVYTNMACGSPSCSSVASDIHGWMYGVMDHNLIDLLVNTVNNGVRVDEASMAGDPLSLGNGSWNTATNFGTNAFIFFENNTVNGGAINDCIFGGRQVLRYNTINGSFIQEHEMSDDIRGCRASETYGNVFNGDLSTIVDGTAVYHRMGTSLSWGNITTNVPYMFTLVNDRTDLGHPVLAPPASWGECGNSLGPSPWDGNSNAFGYPCMDQVGRGFGHFVQGLFPQKCDPSTTNCTNHVYTGSWMTNMLEPSYEWLNQHNVAPGYGQWACSGLSHDENTVKENRDYFCYTLIWNGSAFVSGIADASGRVASVFNGTIGTGSGLLAARPSTCTAGAGGMYAASPTGSYGVAYWGTDTTTLYICTATNTWTAVYTPYTYPHPLVSSPTQVATPTSCTAAMICGGGTFATTQTVTLSTATSGATICFTTDLSTPTTNGAGTCTHGTTYSTTLSVSSNQTIKFVGSKSGLTDSTVVSNAYVISVAATGGTTVSPGVTVNGGTSVSFNKQINPQPIGNWVGSYGADGYVLAASTKSIPPYATFSVKSGTPFSWAPVTTDGRGLELQANSLSVTLSRIASCWYGQSDVFDIAITDGKSHPLEAYFCDWDGNGARAETVTITDAVTGALLDSRNLTDFQGGLYLQWSISGHVHLNVTQVSGANAVIGGLFFS